MKMTRAVAVSRAKSIQEWLICVMEFVCLLLVILDCNTVLRHAALKENYFDYYIKYWGVISYGILIALLILSDSGALKEVFRLKYLLICDLLFVIVFYRFNVDIPNLYVETETEFIVLFLFFINELVILFRIYAYRGEGFRLIYKLENILVFLTVASVILWFGACIMNALGENSDVTVNWGSTYDNTNYLNLYFRRYVVASDVNKNLGLFVEPPMYGVFLNFGLYTELFLKKKTNPLIIVVFAAGLISCRAILALMIALIAVGFKLLELIAGKWYAKYVVITGFVVIAAGISFLMIFKLNNESNSLATHIDDVAAPVKCWLNNNIFWGTGYNREGPIQKYMSSFRENNLGLSNSIAVVLAEGGLVLFTYYLIPFIVLAIQFFKKNKRLAYWGLGMFLVYSLVIIHTNLIIFLFLAFGYSLLDLQLDFGKKGKRGLHISLKLLTPEDNIQSENAEKSEKTELFAAPSGVLMVFAFIPVFMSFYSVIVEKNTDGGSVFAIIVTLCLTAIMLMDCLGKFPVLFPKVGIRTRITVLETAIWAVYLLLGHMYRSLNFFLERNNLLLQQSQWNFVRLVVVLYAVAVGMQMLFAAGTGCKTDIVKQERNNL